MPKTSNWIIRNSPYPGTANQILYGVDPDLEEATDPPTDEPTDEPSDPDINLLLLDYADELYEDDEFLELEGETDVGLEIEE